MAGTTPNLNLAPASASATEPPLPLPSPAPPQPPPPPPQPSGRANERAIRAAVLDNTLFNPADPSVKHDIMQTIIQYLHDEGYHTSAMVMHDEANLKSKSLASKRSQLRRMKRAILDGDWIEVDRLLSRTTFRNLNAFKYAVHRQQFLELIDARDTQKAFSILQRRLKDLEAFAHTTDEFRDLCYLLTCQSVADAPSFRNWDGVAASRAALVKQYGRNLDFDTRPSSDLYTSSTATPVDERDVPPGRLMALLQQALAYQISSCRRLPSALPHVSTILEDYHSPAIPNTRAVTMRTPHPGVKCVSWVGDDGSALASGSSSGEVHLWSPTNGRCLAVLRGHSARVWDVCATPNARLLASAAGDECIRLWRISDELVHAEAATPPATVTLTTASQPTATLSSSSSSSATAPAPATTKADITTPLSSEVDMTSAYYATDASVTCQAVLHDHTKDVYSVRFHPRDNALVSGGYDKCIRLHDVETGAVVKKFSGHRAAICSVGFNARGNMIISGSKDTTIKFWDVMSGSCVRTINGHLGEVTSVETNAAGTLVLSGSKDNSNRLWDTRTSRALRRFKGHQNTSKNFVRVGFGPGETTVVGGSEDGVVYVWDVATTDVVSKLGPAEGVVYAAAWNSRQSLLASCSHDGTVSTWCYDESV